MKELRKNIFEKTLKIISNNILPGDIYLLKSTMETPPQSVKSIQW